MFLVLANSFALACLHVEPSMCNTQNLCLTTLMSAMIFNALAWRHVCVNLNDCKVLCWTCGCWLGPGNFTSSNNFRFDSPAWKPLKRCHRCCKIAGFDFGHCKRYRSLKPQKATDLLLRTLREDLQKINVKSPTLKRQKTQDLCQICRFFGGMICPDGNQQNNTYVYLRRVVFI